MGVSLRLEAQRELKKIEGVHVWFKWAYHFYFPIEDLLCHMI